MLGSLSERQSAALDTAAVNSLGCDRPAPAITMSYEPGSTDCRILIACKAQIESMLLELNRIDDAEHIRRQLVSIHNQLEGLHELRRSRKQLDEVHLAPPELSAGLR